MRLTEEAGLAVSGLLRSKHGLVCDSSYQVTSVKQFLYRVMCECRLELWQLSKSRGIEKLLLDISKVNIVTRKTNTGALIITG